jgi:hypothetical protein
LPGSALPLAPRATTRSTLPAVAARSGPAKRFSEACIWCLALQIDWMLKACGCGPTIARTRHATRRKTGQIRLGEGDSQKALLTAGHVTGRTLVYDLESYENFDSAKSSYTHTMTTISEAGWKSLLPSPRGLSCCNSKTQKEPAHLGANVDTQVSKAGCRGPARSYIIAICSKLYFALLREQACKHS